MPFTAAVCPSPTLPTSDAASGVAGAGVPGAAVVRRGAARRRSATLGDGCRTWESSSPYRDSAASWGERTTVAVHTGHATVVRP
ncbi:hypothetical protein ACNTMW_07905 [Planosporangium sp. 12N6]|uniref:hypothetical protein n=1 Tax=Planosporangium spinosum TaxID=3402278 RepID=UPI003CEE8908